MEKTSDNPYNYKLLDVLPRGPGGLLPSFRRHQRLTRGWTAIRTSPATAETPRLDYREYPDWTSAMADAVTDPHELVRLLGLPDSMAETAERAAGSFRVLVPRPYLARIRPGDPNDPLLRQVLPAEAEQSDQPGFTADPLGETQSQAEPGLLAKYRNRVLVLTSGACGVHCRFCFRRHFPYHPDPTANSHRWEPALAHIAADTTVHEVILSGGDPLTLTDDILNHCLQQIADIPHVRRIRIHTRLPIVIPQRVTDDLLANLRRKQATWVVVHVNHPAEIDRYVAAALGRLIDAGVPVLSQSVLLRGVNDRLEVLAALYERLIDLRVAPYYLHQLDRVAGAAHFEVAESVGRGLMTALRARLPGYAIPRYVRETPSQPNKDVLA